MHVCHANNLDFRKVLRLCIISSHMLTKAQAAQPVSHALEFCAGRRTFPICFPPNFSDPKMGRWIMLMLFVYVPKCSICYRNTRHICCKMKMKILQDDRLRFSNVLGQVSINAFKGKGEMPISNSLPSWYIMLTHLFFYAASRWKTPHGSFSLPSNKCWKLIFQPINVSGTTECNFHKFITWYLLSCQ